MVEVAAPGEITALWLSWGGVSRQGVVAGAWAGMVSGVGDDLS